SQTLRLTAPSRRSLTEVCASMVRRFHNIRIGAETKKAITAPPSSRIGGKAITFLHTSIAIRMVGFLREEGILLPPLSGTLSTLQHACGML
ncbi:MAG: hypothetical protein IJW44_02660, partial [Clostridia bacterium]|nr:hypothetical protein [Clostridia bacterium]